jgi:hypothetical protein
VSSSKRVLAISTHVVQAVVTAQRLRSSDSWANRFYLITDGTSREKWRRRPIVPQAVLKQALTSNMVIA